TSLSYNYNLDTIRVNTRSDKGDFGIDKHRLPTVNYSSLPLELQTLVKLELDKLKVTLPPSSAVAGIYASVDRTSGVWEAPANVSLNKVSGLTRQITERVQETLDVDVVAGKSVNVIRSFSGKGILI